MVSRSVVAVLVIGTVAACGSGIDRQTELARKRILALDAAEAARIVAFCRSWSQEGALRVDQFPSVLPVRPTSASKHGNVLTFAWWNTSHWEEDDPHPGFELICSEQASAGARPIAAGLWYRDAPMSGE